MQEDPQAFLDIAQQLEVSPHQILFIDDTLININAAQKAGFQTLHFQSNTQLITTLDSIFLKS